VNVLELNLDLDSRFADKKIAEAKKKEATAAPHQN